MNDLPLVTRHPHDVAQIRLPMHGNAMRYVNAYLFRDGDSHVLVDCGWKEDVVLAMLVEGLRELGLRVRDVDRLIVTHAHFDHYGLAATLRREGVPSLAMHATEADFARKLVGDRASSDRAADAWLARNGFVNPEPSEGNFSAERSEFVDADETIADGERVGRLEAVFTPGHTPGHLCFVDAQTNVVLTGDHVLERVSPHVGVWYGDAGDPLGDYLASLRRVLAIDADRAFPAHGEPFDGLHARTRRLLEHHDEREARVIAALEGRRASAADVARTLAWTRRNLSLDALEPDHREFAVAETIAHLEHLRERGIVARFDDGDALRYERA